MNLTRFMVVVVANTSTIFMVNISWW